MNQLLCLINIVENLMFFLLELKISRIVLMKKKSTKFLVFKVTGPRLVFSIEILSENDSNHDKKKIVNCIFFGDDDFTFKTVAKLYAFILMFHLKFGCSFKIEAEIHLLFL